MSDSKKDSTLSMDDLPAGWVQQYDPKSDHPFWVDTKAKPPRSIWVHPYEDEQFLNDHPDIRDRHSKPAGKTGKTSDEREGSRKGTPQPAPGEAPPPYSPRRHSFTAEPSHHRRRDEEIGGTSASAAAPSTKPSNKGKEKEKDKGKEKPRSFLGKVKDKAIGTKEEREEARRREMIAQQRYAEQRRQQRRANPYYDDYYGPGSSSRYGPSTSYGSSAFGGSSMGPSPFGPAMYNPPAGNPYVYGQPGYGDRYGYGGRRGYGGGGGFGGGFGGGGGSLALPLLGGLAGGLLLGDIFDGGGLF